MKFKFLPGAVKHPALLYKILFNTEDGQRCLLDLMKRYNVFSPKHHTDPYKAAFHAGQRSVVLHIMETLNINESEVLIANKIIQEQNND